MLSLVERAALAIVAAPCMFGVIAFLGGVYSLVFQVYFFLKNGVWLGLKLKNALKAALEEYNGFRSIPDWLQDDVQFNELSWVGINRAFEYILNSNSILALMIIIPTSGLLLSIILLFILVKSTEKHS